MTLERLTEAFRQWDLNASEGEWEDREDPEENAKKTRLHVQSIY